MAKFVYMSKKTREAVEKALTLKDRKERNKIINHELFDLFQAENRDYQVGVSNVEIFQEWKKEFLAKNFGTTAEPTTTEQPKTTRKKSKTKTATTKTTATSRDKKTDSKTTATAPKTNTKSNSRGKSQPKTETATEIDRNTYIAKLKADYISGRITAEQFATLLAI